MRQRFSELVISVIAAMEAAYLGPSNGQSAAVSHAMRQLECKPIKPPAKKSWLVSDPQSLLSNSVAAHVSADLYAPVPHLP